MIRSMLTIAGLTAALVLAPVSKEAAAATAASDAALAAKLKGNWAGDWALPGFGSGKFELIVTEVNGTNVKGNANWYGIAAGDYEGPLTSAVVQNGQLVGKQGNAVIKLSLKGDNALSGTWEHGGYSGPLNVKR